MKKISSVLLRVGIALVVIWFGYQQLTDASSWLAYLPTWTTSLPISQLSIIYLNGWFELVFGTMLFFGLYTRGAALLVALHMLDITYTVGYGAIGVRDFGLAIMALSVFFHGASPLSIDYLFGSDNMPPQVSEPGSQQPSRQQYFAKLAKATSPSPEQSVRRIQ